MESRMIIWHRESELTEDVKNKCEKIGLPKEWVRFMCGEVFDFDGEIPGWLKGKDFEIVSFSTYMMMRENVYAAIAKA